MRKNQVLESVSIVLGVLVVFVVQKTILSSYSTYLLALLIIFTTIYISIKKRSKSASQIFSGSPPELFALIAIITFIIALTNGLFSPLFFFLYFILFLLAFMCEPITIWVFLGSIIFYFLPQAFSNITTDTFIKLGSLLLISPIAYFIGHEFERRALLSKRIESKTDEIIERAQVLKEETSPKSADEEEAIDEIIEEAQSLKEDAED